MSKKKKKEKWFPLEVAAARLLSFHANPVRNNNIDDSLHTAHKAFRLGQSPAISLNGPHPPAIKQCMLGHEMSRGSHSDVVHALQLYVGCAWRSRGNKTNQSCNRWYRPVKWLRLVTLECVCVCVCVCVWVCVSVVQYSLSVYCRVTFRASGRTPGV